MKFYFHPEADRELLELDKRKQKIVRNVVEEFKHEGMDSEKFGRLTDNENNLDCFRLKIKQKEPVDINQRIIVSVVSGQFVAYGLEHRDDVYSEKYLKKIKDRMY